MTEVQVKRWSKYLTDMELITRTISLSFLHSWAGAVWSKHWYLHLPRYHTESHDPSAPVWHVPVFAVHSPHLTSAGIWYSYRVRNTASVAWAGIVSYFPEAGSYPAADILSVPEYHTDTALAENLHFCPWVLPAQWIPVTGSAPDRYSPAEVSALHCLRPR